MIIHLSVSFSSSMQLLFMRETQNVLHKTLENLEKALTEVRAGAIKL